MVDIICGGVTNFQKLGGNRVYTKIEINNQIIWFTDDLAKATSPSCYGQKVALVARTGQKGGWLGMTAPKRFGLIEPMASFQKGINEAREKLTSLLSLFQIEESEIKTPDDLIRHRELIRSQAILGDKLAADVLNIIDTTVAETGLSYFGKISTPYKNSNNGAYCFVNLSPTESARITVWGSAADELLNTPKGTEMLFEHIRETAPLIKNEKTTRNFSCEKFRVV